MIITIITIKRGSRGRYNQQQQQQQQQQQHNQNNPKVWAGKKQGTTPLTGLQMNILNHSMLILRMVCDTSLAVASVLSASKFC
eukprot:1161081-Pelagomonas_calceolata.AAC.9